jgi:hypothetical protein
MVAFTAGDTLTAAALNSAFNSLAINAQTGTTYTLVVTDAGGMISLTNSSPIALTIPTNANVALPIGATVLIAQTGSGQITLAGSAGVTVNGTPGLKLRTQWSAATLVKRAENTWLAFGDLVS